MTTTEATKLCPACAEEIKSIAKKCKHCGEILDKSILPTPTATASTLSEDNRMKIAKDLEGVSMPTGKLLGLTIATGGWLYLLLHLNRINEKFNNTFNNTLSEKMVASITFVYGAFLLLFTSTFSFLNGLAQSRAGSSKLRDAIDIMSFTQLITYAALILIIVLSFQMRKGLIEYAKNKHNFELKMNKFHTFAFSLFYINYTLNKLKNM